jgi:acrylyl-CoA reductase (NADPH)
MSFVALVSQRLDTGEVESRPETLDNSALPPGDVLVSVEWAGLNYKDALCLNGMGGLVRTWPHVAGIDFAGRVIESRSGRYHPGQPVVLTGWRVGELHWGGYAQRARVQSDWLVPLPKALSTRDAMILGTAGLTAMLAINRLKAEGVNHDSGEVLVTGAGGGVGSIAIMLLARLGYKVTAVTGRPGLVDRLKQLGADSVISRAEIGEASGKVLNKERWAGVVDTVGGPMLAEILKSVRYDGVVAAIGAAAGAEFPGSVIPFILRGVTLAGIDSVMQSYEQRLAAWDRLSTLYSPAVYSSMVGEVSLEALPALSKTMLEGGVAGRTIVNPRQAGNS